jgi:hypothetical protein
LRDTLLGEMVRPCNAAAVRFRKPDSTIANEKARGQFPGAGFCDFCDDEDMPVICPTCQTFLGRDSCSMPARVPAARTDD